MRVVVPFLVVGLIALIWAVIDRAHQIPDHHPGT